MEEHRWPLVPIFGTPAGERRGDERRRREPERGQGSAVQRKHRGGEPAGRASAHHDESPAATASAAGTSSDGSSPTPEPRPQRQRAAASDVDGGGPRRWGVADQDRPDGRAGTHRPDRRDTAVATTGLRVTRSARLRVITRSGTDGHRGPPPPAVGRRVRRNGRLADGLPRTARRRTPRPSRSPGRSAAVPRGRVSRARPLETPGRRRRRRARS